MRKDYASELTKDDLIKSGIAWIDIETLTVYGNSGNEISPIINKQGYLMIPLYSIDNEGNKVKLDRIYKWQNKDGTTSSCLSYIYKMNLIGLHRVLWAWVYGKVPGGYIVDHINNKHYKLEDYKLDNLQCITQADNLAKDLPNHNTRLIKPARNKSLEYYENKLNHYIELYIKAKKEHNAIAAHRCRANISANKGKIRYLLKEKENNDRDVEEIKLH